MREYQFKPIRSKYFRRSIIFTANPSLNTATSSLVGRAIVRVLYRGITDNQARILQELLRQKPAVYPEGLVTGYFEPLTQQAVRNLQCQYGIVCGGTPLTTGWSQVGPRTRAKLIELYP